MKLQDGACAVTVLRTGVRPKLWRDVCNSIYEDRVSSRRALIRLIGDAPVGLLQSEQVALRMHALTGAGPDSVIASISVWLVLRRWTSLGRVTHLRVR